MEGQSSYDLTQGGGKQSRWAYEWFVRADNVDLSGVAASDLS
jgi:hypothetical protein